MTPPLILNIFSNLDENKKIKETVKNLKSNQILNLCLTTIFYHILYGNYTYLRIVLPYGNYTSIYDKNKKWQGVKKHNEEKIKPID